MPEAFSLGPLLLPTLRLGVVAALLLGIFAAGLLARWLALDARWVRGAADLGVLIGLAGARLGYVLMHWPAYAPEPWTALYVWQPGYSPLAGILAGTAFAVWRLTRRPAHQRLQYAGALAGGAASAAMLGATLLLALQVPLGGDRLVLRPQSRAPGPVVALLGAELRQRLAGDRLPAFALHDLEGRQVHSKTLAGRVVVLNFWATWCGPCRREMPLLDMMQQQYAARGVTVLGIALAEPAPRVAAFVRRLGVSYPVWVDPPAATGDSATQRLYERFGGVGLPTTFFIDREGLIRDVYVGELARAPLREQIETLLDHAPG